MGVFLRALGAFDLAAHWASYDTLWQVEKDKFCLKVLNRLYPEVKKYGDIKEIKGGELGYVDVISAGMPCQPYSTAGKRRGVGDDRYLWPETLRIIKEVRPGWIFLENVVGLFSILSPDSGFRVEGKERVLLYPHENGGREYAREVLRIEKKLIGQIVEEIEEAGYSPIRAIDRTPIVFEVPACSLGAPHIRYRLLLPAYDTKRRMPLEWEIPESAFSLS